MMTTIIVIGIIRKRIMKIMIIMTRRKGIAVTIMILMKMRKIIIIIIRMSQSDDKHFNNFSKIIYFHLFVKQQIYQWKQSRKRLKICKDIGLCIMLNYFFNRKFKKRFILESTE